MYGIEAISANNGWAQAIAGALIVMSGLAVLSFVISQMHKIISWFEKRPSPTADQRPETTETPPSVLEDLASTARAYRAISAELGDAFALPLLYALLQQDDQPHPHLTIRSLREAGYLVPVDEDQFAWKNI